MFFLVVIICVLGWLGPALKNGADINLGDIDNLHCHLRMPRLHNRVDRQLGDCVGRLRTYPVDSPQNQKTFLNNNQPCHSGIFSAISRYSI